MTFKLNGRHDTFVGSALAKAAQLGVKHGADAFCLRSARGQGAGDVQVGTGGVLGPPMRDSCPQIGNNSA